MARAAGIQAVLRPDCVWSLADAAREVAPAAGRDPGRVLISVTRSPDLGVEALNRALLGRLAAGDALGGVELLTTCVPEDGAALRALGREFGVPVREPLTWQEVVAEAKAAAALVTNRLHGLILASLGRAAVVPVADRRKALAFVRDAGLDLFARGAGEVSPELIARARAEGEEVRARVAAFAAVCHGAVESPFDLVPG